MNEATVTLSLSEYEASIVRGALDESALHWADEPGHAETAMMLREQIHNQLPEEWRDDH